MKQEYQQNGNGPKPVDVEAVYHPSEVTLRSIRVQGDEARPRRGYLFCGDPNLRPTCSATKLASIVSPRLSK